MGKVGMTPERRDYLRRKGALDRHEAAELFEEVERLQRITACAAEWRPEIARPKCGCDAKSGCHAARMWDAALVYDDAVRGTP